MPASHPLRDRRRDRPVVVSDRVERWRAGRADALRDHLSRVNEILQPYGKRLMFWGDIAVRYPELLRILPKTMIANA
jgi:hypothetical protein